MFGAGVFVSCIFFIGLREGGFTNSNSVQATSNFLPILSDSLRTLYPAGHNSLALKKHVSHFKQRIILVLSRLVEMLSEVIVTPAQPPSVKTKAKINKDLVKNKVGLKICGAAMN